MHNRKAFIIPCIGLITSLSLTSALQAQDSASSFNAASAAPSSSAPENTNWSGEAEFGLVVSTGNTENTSLNGGLNLKHATGMWRQAIGADFYFAEDDGDKDAENYKASYKVDYILSDRSYAFGFLKYDSDEFANIDSRFHEIIGYGYHAVKTDKHLFKTDVGIGGRQTQYIDNSPDDNEAVLHLGLHYKGQLTPNTSLSEDFISHIGSENTFVESITGLKIAMTKKLAVKLKYTIRTNTDPQGSDEIEKTDTITSVNLVLDF